MSIVKKNLIANFIGSAWSAVAAIAFIPLYIHFMGIESYGLVGFYLTLQALFAVLDLGLTATVSRELAKLSAQENSAQEMRNLVRTMEMVYWAISFLIVLSIILIAPWVGTRWLNASELSHESIQQAITLMGFLIGFRMLYGFYCGGLLGLQRHVLLNIAKIAIETLKSVGVILVLWLLSPTIIAFFLWQLGVTALSVLIMFILLWRCLPTYSKRPAYQVTIFRKIWKFAAGMSLIAILAAILVQMDKVILSKMLSLQAFAYYSLASVVAMGLYLFISPVFSTIYPRFTQLVEVNNKTALVNLYHTSCQLVAVLVVPVTLVIAFFSRDLLIIWTHDEMIATSAAPILSILIIGTALNGMMNIPVALQLAHGWTRLTVYMNVVALFLFIPGLIIAVKLNGMKGAAMIWVALNAGYILFGIRIMHKRLLKKEYKYWLIEDFMFPIIGAFWVTCLFWFIKPDFENSALTMLYVLCTYLISTIGALFFARNIKKEVLLYFQKYI